MKIKDFYLERYFAEYEFNSPFQLSSSDCETLSIRELFDLTGSNPDELFDLRLNYTESQGLPELREEIAKLYNYITKENIVVFSGAEEGIYTFMHSILEFGDDIIVQTPCYQSLHEVARSIGCNVIEWKMEEENQWKLDLDYLKEKINKKTKVIVINNPHNPTGAIMEQEKYMKLIDICKENQIMIFSDEVYRFGEYNQNDALIPMVDLYDNSVSLGVMSKSFGLPGLRIGWIVSKNTSLITNLQTQKDYTTICNSGPSEILSLVALRSKEKLLKRTNKIIQNNLRIMDKFMVDYSSHFKWNRPQGGSIGFVKVIFKNNFTDIFCINLIKSVGVMLLPSTLFQYGNNHFRIGLGRKNFNEGLEQLKNYLNEMLENGI